MRILEVIKIYLNEFNKLREIFSDIARYKLIKQCRYMRR